MEKGRQARAHLISSTAETMIAESDVIADPAARRLAARLLRQGAMFDRLVRTPRTPSMVHQLRVLTRRMRAACTVARRLGPADAVEELARRLRKLGRALGGRRTLDVAAKDYAALSGGATHPAIEGAKAEADAALTRRLRPKHREGMLAAIGTAADALRVTESEAGSLERFLKDRSQGLHDSLEAESKRDLHLLRIEAKKFRYALETAKSLGLRTSSRDELALKRLQRRLGRIHDLESLRSLLPPRDPVALRAAARESALRAGVAPLAAALKSVASRISGRNGRSS